MRLDGGRAPVDHSWFPVFPENVCERFNGGGGFLEDRPVVPNCCTDLLVPLGYLVPMSPAAGVSHSH